MNGGGRQQAWNGQDEIGRLSKRKKEKIGKHESKKYDNIVGKLYTGRSTCNFIDNENI